jgi:2-iminoacetate synthase ThiH
MLADVVRQRLVPGHDVTYIVSRNINYTNVCWVRCSFCNFYRTPGSNAPDSYVLTRE